MDDTDFPAEFDRVLFTEKQIAARVKELAAQVDEDYAGEDLLLVGVLKGAMVRSLQARQPKTLRLLTLLRKPEAVRNQLDVAYVGFDIDNEFVVGYGMDHHEKFRNMGNIGVLNS